MRVAISNKVVADDS